MGYSVSIACDKFCVGLVAESGESIVSDSRRSVLGLCSKDVLTIEIKCKKGPLEKCHCSFNLDRPKYSRLSYLGEGRC